MKVAPVAVVLLLCLSALLVAIPAAKQAAALPVVQTTSQYCQNFGGPASTSLTCTAAFGSAVTDTSDYVVLGFVLGNSTEASCLSGSSCTLQAAYETGLYAQDLTGVQTEGTSYLAGQEQIQAMTSGNAAAMTSLGVQYTFTLSNGEDIQMGVTVYGVEVTGLDPSGWLCPGSIDCSTSGFGSSYSVSPSATGTDSSYVYVGFVGSIPAATLTPTAGYTTITGASDSNYATIGQYEVSASDSLPISGTSSPSMTGGVVLGEIFGLGSALGQSGWIPTGAPIPMTFSNPSCYSYSGYVYCAGSEGSNTVQSYSTSIASTGVLGTTWSTETTFSDASGSPVQCFGYLAFMYCMDDVSGVTWSASLSSGAISAWSVKTTYVQLTVVGGAHSNVAPGLIVSGGYVYAIGGNVTNALGAVCKAGSTCPTTLWGVTYGYIETQVASLSSGTVGAWSVVTGTSQYSQPVYATDTTGNAPVSCAMVGSDAYCLGSVLHHSGANRGEFVTVGSGSLGAWATIVGTGGPGNGGASCFGWASQFTCVLGILTTLGVSSPTGDVLTYTGGGSGTWSAISGLSPYAAAHQAQQGGDADGTGCQTDGSTYITCIDVQFLGSFVTSDTAAYSVNHCASAFTASAAYGVFCMDFPNAASIAQGGQGHNYQSSASAGTCTLPVTAGDLILDVVYTSHDFTYYAATSDSLGSQLFTGMNQTYFTAAYSGDASHFVVSYGIAATSNTDTFTLTLGSGSYASFCYDVSGIAGDSSRGSGQVGAFGEGTGSAPATVGQDVLSGQLLVALMTSASSGTYTAGAGFYLNAADTVHDTVDSLYVGSEINAPSSAPHFIISIETNPVDLKNALTVQGTLYPDNPITLSVTNGSIISLKAAGTALKMPGFLVYTFVSWSQGGLQDQSYTVTGNATLIADYTNGASSACATYSGYGSNALEQQLNHGCEWSVVFNSWFALLGPYLLAFIDFLPALAIYLRTESPAAGMGVYVLVYIVLVAGLAGTHLTSFPTTIDTVAPGLLGAVIAGSLFQLWRSGKGG